MQELFTRRAVLFIALTFGLSWGAVALFVLFGYTLGQGVVGFVFPVLYMFFPLISAYILIKKDSTAQFKPSIGLTFTFNRWFVVAWLLPIVLSMLIIGVNVLVPDASFSWEMQGALQRFEQIMSPQEFQEMKHSIDTMPIHPFYMAIIQAIAAGITINALVAFGEEAGWRGYLYYEFKGLNFWKVSLFIGTVWGIWHAPLIAMGHNYAQHPYIGIVFMTVWTILLTPLFLFIRQKSNSVLAASILHGSLNATAGLPIMMIVGGNDLLNSWTGLSGFAVLAVVNVILYFFVKSDHLT